MELSWRFSFAVYFEVLARFVFVRETILPDLERTFAALELAALLASLAGFAVLGEVHMQADIQDSYRFCSRIATLCCISG